MEMKKAVDTGESAYTVSKADISQYKNFEKITNTKDDEYKEKGKPAVECDAVSADGDTVRISDTSRKLRNLISVPTEKLKQLYASKQISKASYDKEMRRRSIKEEPSSDTE